MMDSVEARRFNAVTIAGLLAVALCPFLRPTYLATLEWALAQPLLAAELLLLLGIVWGVSLRDFGIQNLFYHERRAVQFVSGLGAAMLAAHLASVAYLLDIHQSWGGPSWPRIRQGIERLFPGLVEATLRHAPGPFREAHRLFSFVALVLPVLLAAVAARAIVPPLARCATRLRSRVWPAQRDESRPPGKTRSSAVSRLPFLLGVLVGGMVSIGGLALFLVYPGAARFLAHPVCEAPGFLTAGLLQCPAKVWHAAAPGGPAGAKVMLKMDEATLMHDLKLSHFALVLVVFAALSLAGHLGAKLPTALTLCVLLSVLASVYGFLVIGPIRYRHYSPGAIVTLLALWLVLCCGLPRYKTRIPGLAGPDGADPYDGPPLDLIDYRNRKRRADNVASTTVPSTRYGDADLRPRLDSEAVLETWLKEYHRRNGNDAPPPKLAVIATSGGASRAALWTGRVLTRLEATLPGFPQQLRLIAGASGGMVGASLYAASLDGRGSRTRAERKALVTALRRNSISRIAQTLLLHDLPMYWLPFGMRKWDRGRALDAALIDHSLLGPDAASPLATPFRELAGGEAAGWRPSLVFSPMLIEDGRRLLISNLDLGFLTMTVGSYLINEPDKQRQQDLDHDVYSRSAVELFDLFPEAAGLTVATAARLSATFPFISPTPSLPTNPQRRVVDAGYFDNYGVAVAGAWINHHRDWLLDNTGGVVLIQLRDALGEKARRNLTFAGEQYPSFWRKGFRGFLGPLEGAVAARASVMAFRNDERVEMLSAAFNDDPRAGVVRHGGPFAPECPFFTTVVFEYGGQAAMDWHLTRAEALDILDDIGGERNRRRMEQLAAWWASHPWRAWEPAAVQAEGGQI